MEPKATRLAALLQSNGQSPMTPEDEANFKLWSLINDVPQSNDYNMRGFYQSLQVPNAKGGSINPNDGMMHYPDTFKLPNHETFSTDSGYYDPSTMKDTPSWVGGKIGNTDYESWALRKPSGGIVKTEAPWMKKGD